MNNKDIQIPKKSRLKQLFCKHYFQEGEFENGNNPLGLKNLSGTKITIVCVKCGKIKDSYFAKDIYL